MKIYNVLQIIIDILKLQFLPCNILAFDYNDIFVPILCRVLKLEKFSFSFCKEWIVFIYEEHTGFRYWHFYCQKYMAIEYWVIEMKIKKSDLFYCHLSIVLFGILYRMVLFIESFLNGFDSASNTPEKLNANRLQWKPMN